MRSQVNAYLFFCELVWELVCWHSHISEIEKTLLTLSLFLLICNSLGCMQAAIAARYWMEANWSKASPDEGHLSLFAWNNVRPAKDATGFASGLELLIFSYVNPSLQKKNFGKQNFDEFDIIWLSVLLQLPFLFLCVVLGRYFRFWFENWLLQCPRFAGLLAVLGNSMKLVLAWAQFFDQFLHF